MSYQIQDLEDCSYLYIRYFDRVDDEMLLEAFQKMLKSPGLGQKDLLINYADVTDYAVTFDGMRQLTDRIQESPEINAARTDRKIALFVSTNVEYGMGRVFMAQLENMPSHYGLFRTLSEAKVWLGVDPGLNECDCCSG